MIQSLGHIRQEIMEVLEEMLLPQMPAVRQETLAKRGAGPNSVNRIQSRHHAVLTFARSSRHGINVWRQGRAHAVIDAVLGPELEDLVAEVRLIITRDNKTQLQDIVEKCCLGL